MGQSLTRTDMWRRHLGNLSWLVADKAVRMAVALVVSATVARHLGPAQFGTFSYVLAVVAIFGAIAPLGLNAIVVRDLVDDSPHASVIIGSTMLLMTITGAMAYVGVVLAIAHLRPTDTTAQLITAIIGAVLALKVTDACKYLFEARTLSKYVVIAESVAFVVGSVSRVVLVMMDAHLTAFAWVMLVEAALASLMLLFVMHRSALRMRRLEFDGQRMKSYFRQGLPLALSSVAIAVYSRIDQVMLGEMIGDDAVGVYAAATRLSEAAFVLPTAIIVTVMPAMTAYRLAEPKRYLNQFQRLYNSLVALAVVFAFVVAWLSDEIVSALFGRSYGSAGGVLAIQIWTLVFFCLSTISGRWLVNEGFVTTALLRNVAGCTMNIVLNWVLIPRYGPQGAAVATLVAYATSSLGWDMLDRRLHGQLQQKLKALLFVDVFTLAARRISPKADN
jgi:O-antigen/teichoic acid export membrane protein